MFSISQFVWRNCGRNYKTINGIERRFYCTNNKVPPTTEKVSLYSRLKSMFKDYWYVAIPVHVVTSGFWIGGFYEVAKSGLDIKNAMRYIGCSETMIEKVGNSGAGNWAVAYALYKIATPARYTVTIFCSTYTINILTRKGIIRTAKEISKPARDMMIAKKDKFLNKNVKPPPGE